MRKMLLTLLCFLMFTSSCFAATAREVLDNYKDIEYSLESGINFRDYSDMYQKAYLAYRRWEEGVTDEAMKDAFMRVNVRYHAIKTVWHGSIYDEHWYPSEVEMELYPYLQKNLQRTSGLFVQWRE